MPRGTEHKPTKKLFMVISLNGNPYVAPNMAFKVGLLELCKRDNVKVVSTTGMVDNA